MHVWYVAPEKDSHIKTALQNVLESKCISVTLTVNQCGCLSEEAAAQHGYSRIVLIRPDFVEIIDSDDERGGWTCRMRVSLSVGWRPHPPYSIRVSIPDISAVTL